MNKKQEVIEIDGVMWVLDTGAALRSGVLSKPQKRFVGQLYTYARPLSDPQPKEDVYIVAQIEYKTITLISLNGGNRWGDSIRVNNTTNITSAEWEALVGEAYLNWFVPKK